MKDHDAELAFGAALADAKERLMQEHDELGGMPETGPPDLDVQAELVACLAKATVLSEMQLARLKLVDYNDERARKTVQIAQGDMRTVVNVVGRCGEMVARSQVYLKKVGYA